ncbi:MAG: hypothetical protein ACREIA_06430 [Opitutaceae bacterium]
MTLRLVRPGRAAISKQLVPSACDRSGGSLMRRPSSSSRPPWARMMKSTGAAPAATSNS